MIDAMLIARCMLVCVCVGGGGGRVYITILNEPLMRLRRKTQ